MPRTRVPQTLFVLVLIAPGLVRAQESASRSDIEARVGRDIQYLASDELGGRGVGTKGIAEAASYIRDEFRRLGLRGGAEDGAYYQHFPMKLGVRLEKARCVLRDPEGATTELSLGKQFTPMAVGGGGKFDEEIVFVGYGVSGWNDTYDDYADIDVAGKVVVMIRREPRQTQRGLPGVSRHAFIATKQRLAIQKKAAAIILVNDPHSSPEAAQDEIGPVNGFGGDGDSGPPFLHIKQSTLDRVLQSAPLKTKSGKALDSVAAIEKHIDATLEPVSQTILGWKCSGEVTFDQSTLDAFNVVGVLEGEGPRANETIVIGAHYDHLGTSGRGSRAPQARRGEIHNGADDNATGTAGVMELARRFAARPKKPSRRLVFIAFSGEESGLVGSSYYCRNPLFPLDDTVLMLNFDMIGRLRNKNLTVFGVGTGKGLKDAVIAAGEGIDVELKPVDSPFLGGSDHLPFYGRQIPVLFCFTGVHAIYHTPDDDFETINVPGTATVLDYSEQLLDAVLALPSPPEFAATPRRRPANRPRRMAYLGVRPNYGDASKGLVLEGVADNSPAQAAGLKTGDAIQTVEGKPITARQEMLELLRSKTPGDEIEVVFTRDGKRRTVKIKLAELPN